MKDNVGLLKEKELVLALNDKQICDLNQNLKFMVKEIFGFVDEKQKLKCELIDGYIKPDFSITYNGITKYVSMKSGRSKDVHQENIKKFILFMRGLNISKKTQQTILLYQYGDLTMDGSGKERLPYEELRYRLRERISEANEELNSNKEFIKTIVNRVIFKGTFEENTPADFVYFGDVNYGVVVSKKQIYRFIEVKNQKFISNLHIGPIMFRPHARYIGKEIKNENNRHLIDFYWPNYEADLRYIARRFYS